MVGKLHKHRFARRLVWQSLFKITLVLLPFLSDGQRFVHPGVPFTRYDLNLLKQNITKEPWLSAYNAFKADAHSQLSYVMRGPAVIVTRAPNLNNIIWQQDMIAIHHLAFMWIFTGDTAYARKATDILDAWAVTNTVWGGNESMLDIGDYAEYWATGADILKSTYPGWTTQNTAHVNNYFANVLYPTSFVPYPLRDQNKGAIQLKIALGAAAFLDDSVKFNQAIEVYRMDAGGGLRNSLPNGEVGDAGRDGHWLVQAAALAWGAEVAYKQGIDMFAELGNRMLAIGELYHKFAFDGDTMTYIPFGGYASYWTSWGIQPGNFSGSMTNTIHAAYALRKGIATPNTDRVRAKIGGVGGDFLFLKSADTSTATILPPVVYPGDHVAAVTHLTNMDIGNAGMTGNAVYNDGAWTVTAAGTSLSNAFNYCFQKMSGNSAVIVKVDSMSQTAGGCGIMVRQSLSPGANYWNIHLAGTGGVGRHGQPKAPWWLKMERVGTRIFGYHSQDGINWTNLLCFYEPNNYSDSLYYGFYAISNNGSVLNKATFSNVSFSAGAPAGSPLVTSATKVSAPIGTAFNYTITADNNPAVFRADNLPAGLTLNSSTGSITGTPEDMGTYEVTLFATNASGTSTTILILQLTSNTPPAAPAAVRATVVNTSEVKISWNSSENATGYSVKRSLDSDGVYETIATGITATSYTDVHPVPELPNYYIVTALADTLESPVSDRVSAAVPPAAPGKPEVIAATGSLKLNWVAGLGAKSYNIKRSNVTGGPYTLIDSVSSSSYTDNSVIDGTPYYYVITSVGTSLESGNSVEGFGMPGATTSNWNASASSERFSDSVNWAEHAAPVNPAILNFRMTEDSAITNDLTGLTTARILFDTMANSYTITGNAVNARNEILNRSASPQYLNTPLVLDSDLIVNAHTQPVTLNGLISGTGGLKTIGRSKVYIQGLNTYSGSTTISGDGSGGFSYDVGIAGTGTGAPGAPTAGPLGTGKIIMDGGSLQSEYGDAILYNDIEVLPGKRSYLYEWSYAVKLYGRLTGSGTLWNDCNTYAGLHMFGDNSGFTGYFVNAKRSGSNRLRFNVPQSGSANATWNLDADAVDCQSLNFPTGTIHFGALTGRGYFRNNAGGAPIMSVGALNTTTSFGGSINGSIGVEKVGTGDWEIWGNHTFSSPTIIRAGRILLANDPVNGSYVSPITVVGGGLSGGGRTSGPITVGTGADSGAVLEPGLRGIGTLTTSSLLTIHADGIFKVEMNFGDSTADKMLAGAVVLDSAVLRPVLIGTDSTTKGVDFTIIENTGNEAIRGIFKGLPELSLIKIGGQDFRITYKGGTGNDVKLLDDRNVPVTITSAQADTALIGRAYSYSITAIKSPTNFSAGNLPAGLTIDTATGIISGTPVQTGIFAVALKASNEISQYTDTLRLVIASSQVDGLIIAAGDGADILEWNRILDLKYNVKRSGVSGGPYTTIAANLQATQYIDTAVVNGQTYYYVVSSVDNTSENSNSSEVAATPVIGHVNYYKMNETGGFRLLDSWGAANGELQADAVRVAGKAGAGVLFDGKAASYGRLPAGAVSSLSTFSIGSWVKMNALSTWMRLFDFGSSTTKYMFLTPQAGLSGGKSIVRYAIKNGSGAEQSLSFNYSFPLNTWVHLAVTQSDTLTTLYINGDAVASTTGITLRPSGLGNTGNNYLGKSQFNDPMLKGAVDEFKIYNRALSESEVKTMMQVKGDQSIEFAQMEPRFLGDTAFLIGATATSGLPVSYTSSDTSVAAIQDGKIYLKSAGSVFLTASQPGNEAFEAAQSVERELIVKPLGVKMLSLDSGGPVTDKNIRPNLQLINNGTKFIPYSDLSIRYWLTPEEYAGINSWIDYAAMGKSNISTKYIQLDRPRQAALGYLQYSFDSTAGLLTADSGSGIIQSRFANADWALLDKTNDYSYVSGSGYTENRRITVYRNGVLVWGTEPEDTVPVCKVAAFTKPASTGSGIIGAYLQLHNTGNTALNYAELKLRYWFTKDNESSLKFWLDYAKLGAESITGKFVSLSTTVANADGYLELSFPSNGALYPLSGTGDIQYRITKEDWSAFDQTNDYSYKAASSLLLNPNVTVYYQGNLIYGNEPHLTTLAGLHYFRSQTAPGIATAKLYPNPVKDVFYIVPAGKYPQGFTLRITDVQGRILQQEVINAYAGSPVKVQLSKRIVAGIYWVCIDKEPPVKMRVR